MAAEQVEGFNHFPELSAQLDDVAAELVKKFAFEVQAHAQTHMSSHSPSAPGEPPGVVTGNLKASLDAEEESRLTWVAFSPAAYAPDLEYGTVHMAARPFMTPAADAVRPDFEHAFAALEAKLKG